MQKLSLSGTKSQFLLSSDGNIKVKHFFHNFKKNPIKDGLIPKRSSYLTFQDHFLHYYWKNDLFKVNRIKMIF